LRSLAGNTQSHFKNYHKHQLKESKTISPHGTIDSDDDPPELYIVNDGSTVNLKASIEITGQI
jgi:hypothetical protein